MYSTISTNSKQVLVWALMFTLVLSVFPTAIADEDDDEWFYEIDYETYDEDGDGSDNTIEIGYDPDTTCYCNTNITVFVEIYDEYGYVGYVYADHTIYDEEGDWFSQDWTPDESGTFDFYVSMYDEWDNHEDSWNVTDIALEPMSGSSDETINVDNGVFNEEDDSLMNDIAFWAHVKEDGEDYVNITVWKKNAIGQWDYYDDGSTDDDGFLTFKNATGGEYLWDAYHDGSHLSKEGGYAVVDNTYTTGHVGVLQDWDNAGDWDDFVVQIPEGNSTSDDGYVEIYDDSDNLVDSGKTDESEGDDWYAFVSYDLEQGNYTHYIYEEEDGDLLQNGSFYSYGSTSTNYDEWFEDWTYETEDTNGDGVANSIITKYDPNTECNCTVDIGVDFSVYNNDTGDYNGGDYYEHEIYSTEIDSFETDEWSPTKDGNYTFEFYLYDEDWNYEDHFNFTVYLECDDDNNNSDCDNDEWFEGWDYDTESTDDDNLADTINVDYDPDTDCDCEVGVSVYMTVYENASGNWVDSTDGQYHEINGTEEEYFTQSWTSANSTSYDFYVYMYDDNWNHEDDFWIYNVFLYAKSGAGGPGDEDEYFDWIYEYVWDDDDDGYNDTVELDYDPDTTCECDINITLYIDIYDNETGAWVNGTEEGYTIYHDDDDYWYQYWSPEYNGTFDFYVKMYDEDENLEDEREYLGVELHARSSGGGDGDNDEWFYDWDYDVDPSDTITIGYDPDTECECEMEIHVEIVIWESDTGDYVDYISANHTIYNGYSDWFTQDWTSSNDDYYDFNVSLYDEDWNLEDGFWIYDVYLSSDGGGGGGDDNGIGHLSDIADWDEDDGYINDYIGAVTEGEDWRYEAYFEIYDENENLVDAGQPDDNGIFVSEDLDEGNYYHYIYYDEGAEDAIHYGIFYSYGGSSGEDSGVINVDMAVLEDSNYDGDPNIFCEEGPCDDAFFKAHEGNWDNGISDVVIEIYEYDSGTGDTEWYETVYTNDTGEAISYDNPCGEYVWNASYSDDEIDKGYYQVWAGCDGTGGGDDDYDEWFSYWDYDVDPSDTIHIGYDPDTECDCYVDVEVYIDVFDSDTGDHVDSLSDDHTIYSGEEDWFVQDWTAYYDGTYDFHVVLYDQEYGHDEDDFWIEDVYLSSDGGGGDNDEWFSHWDYDVDQTSIKIGYDPDTECDCYVDVEVYIDVFDSDTGDHVDSLYDDHTIYSGEEDWFVQDWTAYYDGTYDFHVVLYDQEYGHDEDDFWIEDVYLGADYDEWIHTWIHYVPQDENGNSKWDEIVIGYDPETECDCNVTVDVYLEVYDEDGGEAASSGATHTINGDQEDWFLQEISMNIEPGVYDFYVNMYDEHGNYEEHKEFTLIMSDEWLDYEWAVEDDSKVKIDLQGNTNYDGEIDTSYEFNVYRWNENENDWEEIDSRSEGATISSGDENSASIHFEWEAEESGDYRFVVYMFDEMGQEDSFEFEIDIVLNQAPVIMDLNVNQLFEGQMFDFKVDAFDEDGDDLEYTWDMGTGSMLEGESVRSGYQDDGFYIIKVSVSDGEFTTTKEFEIEVQNLAPILEISFDNEADEGSEISFAAQVEDVSSDEVTVTWTFADGSSQDGNFVQYTFDDDGEYLIVVVAKDEDGGRTEKQIVVVINNVAPIFVEFDMPTNADEGESMLFMVTARDPGNDDITYTFNFGDGTAVMVSPDGNMSHKFADGDTFTIIICAKDEDGGETCRTEVIPVSAIEQLEESGLPGFGLLGALSALGVIGMLRRRTH